MSAHLVDNSSPRVNAPRSLFKSSGTRPLPDGKGNAATTLELDEISEWNGLAEQLGVSRNELFRTALAFYAEHKHAEVAKRIRFIRTGSAMLLAVLVASISFGLEFRRAPSRIKLVTVRAPIVRRAKEVEA